MFKSVWLSLLLEFVGAIGLTVIVLDVSLTDALILAACVVIITFGIFGIVYSIRNG